MTLIQDFNMMKEEDKLYFEAGMVVTLRQNIPNKPMMIVQGKHASLLKDGDSKKGLLKGIICIWFTKDGLLQKEIFNTKDLVLVK